MGGGTNQKIQITQVSKLFLCEEKYEFFSLPKRLKRVIGHFSEKSVSLLFRSSARGRLDFLYRKHERDHGRHYLKSQTTLGPQLLRHYLLLIFFMFPSTLS